jgi:hypothetical protein
MRESEKRLWLMASRGGLQRGRVALTSQQNSSPDIGGLFSVGTAPEADPLIDTLKF